MSVSKSLEITIIPRIILEHFDMSDILNSYLHEHQNQNRLNRTFVQTEVYVNRNGAFEWDRRDI